MDIGDDVEDEPGSGSPADAFGSDGPFEPHVSVPPRIAFSAALQSEGFESEQAPEAHLHDALEQVADLAELGDDEHVVGRLVHVDDAEQVRVLRPARPPADALQDGDLRAGGKRAA